MTGGDAGFVQGAKVVMGRDGTGSSLHPVFGDYRPCKGFHCQIHVST